jgi:hypothetical protein
MGFEKQAKKGSKISRKIRLTVGGSLSSAVEMSPIANAVSDKEVDSKVGLVLYRSNTALYLCFSHDQGAIESSSEPRMTFEAHSH